MDQEEYEREKAFLDWYRFNFIPKIGQMKLNELLMIQGSTEMKINHKRKEIIEGEKK